MSSKNALYSLREKWPELQDSRLQEGRLSLEFARIAESVTNARDIVGTRPPLVGVTEFGEEGNVSIGLDLQPALTASYKNGHRFSLRLNRPNPDRI